MTLTLLQINMNNEHNPLVDIWRLRILTSLNQSESKSLGRGGEKRLGRKGDSQNGVIGELEKL